MLIGGDGLVVFGGAFGVGRGGQVSGGCGNGVFCTGFCASRNILGMAIGYTLRMDVPMSLYAL